RDDWDALAGATVAGHLIECGAQVTGGNFAFFTEIPDLRHPGFPIAEVHSDGSAVITKHPGTGGAVTTETVTAQLLYEIGGPLYLGPDVSTRLDTVHIEQLAKDRIRVSGATGQPPPPQLKVALNVLGGFRNATTFVLTGLDIEAKAALIRDQFRPDVDELTWTLARTDHEDAGTEETASALLHVTARDKDPQRAGRAFSQAAVELALSSYPGFHASAPPSDASPYGVYRAAFVPQDTVPHRAVLPDGSTVDIGPPPAFSETAPQPVESPREATQHKTRREPLGRILGARSGDKGGDANLGVWARTGEAHDWLTGYLTVDRLRELLPEVGNAIRYEFPQLRALNFVVEGILGEGVAENTRFDPQAKALGEWLRARHADIPEALL
ncbi:MAG: hypothetical protein JWO79_2972, partial [Actinomycetia bacterium]|nr:hypothetical protein [Actinomycetes bacterium]